MNLAMASCSEAVPLFLIRLARWETKGRTSARLKTGGEVLYLAVTENLEQDQVGPRVELHGLDAVDDLDGRDIPPAL